jgi:hypothetical protein
MGLFLNHLVCRCCGHVMHQDSTAVQAWLAAAKGHVECIGCFNHLSADAAAMMMLNSSSGRTARWRLQPTAMWSMATNHPQPMLRP